MSDIWNYLFTRVWNCKEQFAMTFVVITQFLFGHFTWVHQNIFLFLGLFRNSPLCKYLIFCVVKTAKKQFVLWYANKNKNLTDEVDKIHFIIMISVILKLIDNFFGNFILKKDHFNLLEREKKIDNMNISIWKGFISVKCFRNFRMNLF